MRLYPASPYRATRTVVGDLVVVLLLIVFAWVGVKVHDGILELTTVGREIQDSGRAVSATARDTARRHRRRVRRAPAAPWTACRSSASNWRTRCATRRGARPTRSAPTASRRARGSSASAASRCAGPSRRRTLAGWLTFLLPAVILLAWKLPPRVRLITRMSTAQRTLRGAPEHILAARAAYSLPYGTLTRYTRDPFGDLAAGRHDGLLAALADDAGVKL